MVEISPSGFGGALASVSLVESLSVIVLDDHNKWWKLVLPVLVGSG